MPHKLLLADDSVTIQRVIELTFADEDVEVVAVGNGQEAIDQVQRDRPDIILADVGMPERNGYEVAAFVKGNPATAHIPVVLLTGAFEPVDEGRARAVGCDGVLVKPFEPQLVISRVKDLLAGREPAGMWSAPPSAQTPVRPGAGDFDMRPPLAATPASNNDPLEAYFDRLDAAFASTPATPAASDPFAGAAPSSAPAAAPRREAIPVARRPTAAPGAANDPFADWDPEIQGDPARPAAVQMPSPTPPAPAAASSPAAIPVSPARPPAAAPAVAPPAPSAPSAPAPAPLPASLVDAFTALLAAEQTIGLSPSLAPPAGSVAAPASGPIQITDDLIDTIAERVLARLSAEARPSILDVAERLVREEIEKIRKTE